MSHIKNPLRKPAKVDIYGLVRSRVLAQGTPYNITKQMIELRRSLKLSVELGIKRPGIRS